MPFNNNIYHIDFRKLLTWLTPAVLRNTFLVEWLLVLIDPVVRLETQFRTFCARIRDQLAITPQVCYLEKMLNDRFDYDFNPGNEEPRRRIVIVDAKEYAPIFLYRKEELKPIHLYRKSQTEKPKNHLYTKGEVGRSSVDFVIKVPSDITYKKTEMIALVDTFKLATKKYNIQDV